MSVYHNKLKSVLFTLTFLIIPVSPWLLDEFEVYP